MAQRRILDLRPEHERRTDPVAGAEPWTLDQVAHHQGALEHDDELYLVGHPDQCREAADILAKVGFKMARDYRQGLHLWKGEYFPDNAERLDFAPVLKGYTEDSPENMLPKK